MKIIVKIILITISLFPLTMFSSAEKIESRVIDLLVDGIVHDDIFVGYFYVPDMLFPLQQKGHQTQKELYRSIDKEFSTSYAFVRRKWAIPADNIDEYILIHQSLLALGVPQKAYLYLQHKSEWLLAIKHPDQRKSVGNFQKMLESEELLNEQNFFAIHNAPLDQEFPHDRSQFVPRVYAAINLSLSSEFSEGAGQIFSKTVQAACF